MGLARDSVAMLGYALMFIGFWWYSPALALIIGGLILFMGAIYAERISSEKAKDDTQ